MIRETPSKKPQNVNGCSKKAGTSGLNDAAMDIYDSEAAQNAFFNAPKVSRRQFVNKRVSKKGGDAGTDDEEEPEQAYDENNDRELNARIAGFMQEFISKKINANNAFETQILEKLNNVVEVESLQCVGTMLDASARVYAFRVDNTHGECFTVRTTIDENKKKKGPAIDDSRNLTRTDENGEAVNNPEEDATTAAVAEDDVDEEGEAAAEEEQRLKKAKQKKARQKESRLAEESCQVENLLEKSASLAERFAAIALPDETVDEETLSAGFDHYINAMEDLNTLRRVKIPFINEKAGNIDRVNEEYGIDDPIYHKVAKEFEEGCAQSFVNNEVLTNPSGYFLILHTNWKNDEPNIPPVPAAFSTKYDPIFDQLEGSLERALAPEPCTLTMLQEFCEEDSDGEDNSLDEMRLLGRRSQAVKRVSQNQQPETSTREPSMEHDAENDMTEEDKSRKAHEELTKFQTLLDDEEQHPAKKDPFEGENFFNNDFSELVRIDADDSDLQKATFHSISDDDAAVFGISTELMAKIRTSLKSQRVLSEELQEMLFDQIGPENRIRLEVVLDTKDLTKKEGPKVGTEVTQPLDFFMTRFSPLIDSVWHATIKKATEDQLSKVGLNFGSKALQRITMRLGASAMKSATKKRRGPYVTPVKTPVRPPLLSTPESRPLSPESMSKSRLSTRRHQFSSARKKAVSRLKFPGAASEGKNKRRSGYHEVSDEEEDVNMSPVSQVSRASTVMAQGKSYIYFWARPREYPRVYLEQVLDEKDNPMQAADLLDMDEVLGLNDDAGIKRATCVTQQSNDSMALEPMDQTPVPAAEKTLQPVNNAEPMAIAELDDSFNHSIDFGDDPQLDIADNLNGQATALDNEEVQQTDKTTENNANNDILNVLNEPTESIVVELLDVEEATTEANQAVRHEPQIEDDSHWKGGPKAAAVQVSTQEAEATKKVKKNIPSKAKRQRLDPQVHEEEEMNWELEKDTPVEKVKALNSHYKASLLTKLPEEGKLDIVGSGSVKLADMYDPMDLVNRSLLYKRKSGYWKNTMSGPEYVRLRSGYAMRSVEEEHRECVGTLTDLSSKKVRTNNEQEQRTAQKTHSISLQEVFGDEMVDDTAANIYDIDISPRQMRSVSPVDGRVLGDEKDEQMEFNGGIIKVRQTRVKAPMVKRAITSVLASKQTDFNAMKSVLESSPIKNKTVDEINEDSDSNDADMDVYSDESDQEEETEDIVGRQSGSVNGTNASSGFKIRGEHHFSNLCAYLPEYLSGRTKLDLNVINTFAITLHMCNEHSLRLVQEVDPQTKVISKEGMADFKIEHSKQ